MGGRSEMFTVHHEPEGHACNMGYVVRNAAGHEVHRGPEWDVKGRARQLNDGTYRDKQAEQARAVADMLRTAKGDVL